MTFLNYFRIIRRMPVFIRRIDVFLRRMNITTCILFVIA